MIKKLLRFNKTKYKNRFRAKPQSRIRKAIPDFGLNRNLVDFDPLCALGGFA
jgi:hypothetical protein